MNVIETKKLSKAYGNSENNFLAVNNINLKVRKKEFVTIVGASGSGKSTLLNLIGGLDSPTEGEVFIDGKDITILSEEQKKIFRRKKVGFIFQQYNLIPVLNVYENIVFPVQLDGKNVDESFISEIIGKLGLRGKERNLPATLSGGQQQRVAIARALASKPTIILADEPTGNLDKKSSEEVLKLLKLMQKSFNQTLMLITHNEQIAQLSDRIICIEDGKIIRDRRINGDIT